MYFFFLNLIVFTLLKIDEDEISGKFNNHIPQNVGNTDYVTHLNNIKKKFTSFIEMKQNSFLDHLNQIKYYQKNKKTLNNNT